MGTMMIFELNCRILIEYHIWQGVQHPVEEIKQIIKYEKFLLLCLGNLMESD